MMKNDVKSLVIFYEYKKKVGVCGVVRAACATLSFELDGGGGGGVTCNMTTPHSIAQTIVADSLLNS